MNNDTKTQIAQLRQEIEKQDKIIVPADSPIAAELKSKQVPYEEQLPMLVFDRLNPPPPARRWVPEPKVYIIRSGRVAELLAEGALVPTAVSR